MLLFLLHLRCTGNKTPAAGGAGAAQAGAVAIKAGEAVHGNMQAWRSRLLLLE